MGRIAKNATLRVFQSTIKPIWEDPRNEGRGAGKWTAILESKKEAVSLFQAIVQRMVARTSASVNGAFLILSCLLPQLTLT